MTEFHSVLQEDSTVVIRYYDFLSTLIDFSIERRAVSSGSPNFFPLADFLPTAVLPTDLSLSAPTSQHISACLFPFTGNHLLLHNGSSGAVSHIILFR